MAITENPLPESGVPGYMTDEQTEKLRAFYARFFQLIDDAPQEGTDDPSKNKSEQAPTDEKAAKKDIPKDDEAKAKQRAEQEMKDATAALEKYGSKRFLATYWRFIAADDPDAIMMRFLRARKYDVNAGVAMLSACMKWRMEGDVEDIIEKGEEGMRNAEGFLKQMEIGKTYTQGTDRKGRPIVYIHVKKHKTFDQSAKALEDFVLFQMECVRFLLADRADKVTMVFDMTGFGLANMDWRCILFIVKCLEAYYPESLNAMLIHNAPWVFQGIWKILAPMLDPVVRAKVQMTKNSQDLQVHIPPEHLVKELGGDNDWKWEFTQIQEGENEKQSDKSGRKKLQAERDQMYKQYEQICRKWTKSGPEDEVVTLTRDLMAKRLRYQYYEIDPYIRGRGVYHRHGNIVGNGTIAFDYPHNGGADEWEVRGYDRSREALEVEIGMLERKIEAMGGKLPSSKKASAGSDDEEEEDRPKRRPSSSRRKSRS